MGKYTNCHPAHSMSAAVTIDATLVANAFTVTSYSRRVGIVIDLIDAPPLLA